MKVEGEEGRQPGRRGKEKEGRQPRRWERKERLAWVSHGNIKGDKLQEHGVEGTERLYAGSRLGIEAEAAVGA